MFFQGFSLKLSCKVSLDAISLQVFINEECPFNHNAIEILDDNTANESDIDLNGSHDDDQCLMIFILLM